MGYPQGNPTKMDLNPLRIGHKAHLGQVSDVISLQVPCMEVVVHDVTVLPPTGALLLQGVIEPQHLGVVLLVRDNPEAMRNSSVVAKNPIGSRFSTLIGGRELGFTPHVDLHLACVVGALIALLH